jgi:hypothetical protein
MASIAADDGDAANRAASLAALERQLAKCDKALQGRNPLSGIVSRAKEPGDL